MDVEKRNGPRRPGDPDSVGKEEALETMAETREA